MDIPQYNEIHHIFPLFGIIYTKLCFFLCFAICHTQSEVYGCWFETWKSLIRDRPFNLQVGLWFFISFRIFFSDNTRVRIFFCLSREEQIIFPELNIRLYDKNSESHYFFFLYQKSEYFFFSIIGNRNIF